MKKFVSALLAFVFTASGLFAFSAEGHKTVAAIANDRLSPAARAAIADILESETLVAASVWPDEIKPTFGRLWNTPEARAFNHSHPTNREWHYVNFPVGASRYSAASPFANSHDIVQTINGCIRVLEGGQYESLTSKEALRWLVHLVGDIHQPMHVVAGYYDLTDLAHPKLETRAAEIERETGDGGAGALDYGPNNMHSMWDKVLVDDIAPINDDPVALANLVAAGATPNESKSTGKHGTWAAKWAGESMRLAKLAYADIAFGEAKLNSHDELASMKVTLQPTVQAYRDKFMPDAKKQVRKAGLRLAQLLNAIEWEGIDE